MMTRILLLALLVVELAYVAAASAQKLAVVSRRQDQVAFIDIESGNIHKSIDTGNFPHEIAHQPGQRYAYVPSYGGNTVTKIDLQEEKSVWSNSYGDYDALHGAYLSNDGRSLWVTAEEKRAVIKIETGTGRLKSEHKTRQYRSHMVTAVTGSEKLYAANIDSGSVSVIHLETGAQSILYTGAGAEGIGHSRSGDEVWVSNRADNSISVIDVFNNTITKSFSSGGVFPVKLKFRPDGREVWISNNRSGTITVFDAASYKLKRTIQVGGRPLGLAFSDDSKFGYVTRPGSNEVVVVEINNDYKIIKRLETPPSPDGVIWVDD